MCLGVAQEALWHKVAVVWDEAAESVARVAPLVTAAPFEMVAQVETV